MTWRTSRVHYVGKDLACLEVQRGIVAACRGTAVDDTPDDRLIGAPREVDVGELRLHRECNVLQPVQ